MICALAATALHLNFSLDVDGHLHFNDLLDRNHLFDLDDSFDVDWLLNDHLFLHFNLHYHFALDGHFHHSLDLYLLDDFDRSLHFHEFFDLHYLGCLQRCHFGLHPSEVVSEGSRCLLRVVIGVGRICGFRDAQNTSDVVEGCGVGKTEVLIMVAFLLNIFQFLLVKLDKLAFTVGVATFEFGEWVNRIIARLGLFAHELISQLIDFKYIKEADKPSRANEKVHLIQKWLRNRCHSEV
jgi:hypothetical protein